MMVLYIVLELRRNSSGFCCNWLSDDGLGSVLFFRASFGRRVNRDARTGRYVFILTRANQHWSHL